MPLSDSITNYIEATITNLSLIFDGQRKDVSKKQLEWEHISQRRIKFLDMKPRQLLTAVGVTAVAGCTSSGSPVDTTAISDEYFEPENDGDPEYLGLHDDHTGAEIENEGYTVHGMCQAIIPVVFDSKPPEGAIIKVYFYQDNNYVDTVESKVGELDAGNRENVELKYCDVEYFNKYKLAVVSA